MFKGPEGHSLTKSLTKSKKWPQALLDSVLFSRPLRYPRAWHMLLASKILELLPKVQAEMQVFLQALKDMGWERK